MLQDLLTNQPNSLRTQISLTKPLKEAIKTKSRLLGESMSEYLRKAAVIRLLVEEEEKKELELIAKNFVGAAKWKKTHPHWKSKTTVKKWIKKLRCEWR